MRPRPASALRLDGAALADAVTEIEWAKVCQIHPDSYVLAATTAGRNPAAGVDGVGPAVPGLRGNCAGTGS